MKKNNKAITTFESIKKEFLNYCDKNGFRENVSEGLFMRVNLIEEIYYFILLNDPMWLGTDALTSIYEYDLYKRYTFCEKDTNLIKWIENLSREEYFCMASKILKKHRTLLDIEVEFKGVGYYTLVRVPTNRGEKLYIKDIDEIKKIFKK